MSYILPTIFILLLSLYLNSTPTQSVLLIKTPIQYATDFAEAIKFKTISYDSSDTEDVVDWSQYTGFMNYLLEKFPLVNQNLHREVINGYALLYRWNGTDPSLKPMMINGHYDVVPVDPIFTLAFTGTIQDGFIYGRGTVDNKLTVMASLEAVEALLTHGFVPKRTVYLAFGFDEEIGGNAGHAHISAYLQSLNVTAEMIIDEGSPIMKAGFLDGINQNTALVGTYEKGYIFYNLTVAGVAGHSAMPPLESAIGILSKAVTHIEGNQFPVQSVDGPAGSPFLKMFTQDQIDNTPYLSTMLRTTTAVTMIRGGDKSNVMASSATVWINHRIVMGSNVTYTLNRVLGLINDSRVTMVIDGELEPSPISDPKAQPYKLLRKTLKHIFGQDLKVVPGQLFANTDTRHYWNVSSNIYRLMPLIQTYEEFGTTFHADNERIPIDSYVKAIQFYKKLIIKLQICNNGTNTYQGAPTYDPDLNDSCETDD